MVAAQKPLSNDHDVMLDFGMRIAVISDTHDRYPPSLPHQISDADEVWHLGDVCAPEVLEDFAVAGGVVVVRGNCDTVGDWPLSLELKREGMGFFLTHVPPKDVPAGCSVVLHGHTHVARDETINGVRWLNPGPVTRPRSGGASYAWLTVERGKLTRWEVVRI
jgi:putative phosphoesterase